MGFNPTAQPGDEDYGLLYTSGSDLGFSNGGAERDQPGSCNGWTPSSAPSCESTPASPAESGGTRGWATIRFRPPNPWAATAIPVRWVRIYAHGFRNAHRFSWDHSDGTMFAAEIGNMQIEEINVVHAGGNYGWFQREGIFDNGINLPGGQMEQVHALPDDILAGITEDPFIYPVAMYDHDEGIAITNGFAYRGSVAELQGKFVFGDIQRGRVFAADVAEMKAADDGVPETVADIEEVQLYVRNADGSTRDVTLWEVDRGSHGKTSSAPISRSAKGGTGNLFVTSRQDGIHPDAGSCRIGE